MRPGEEMESSHYQVYGVEQQKKNRGKTKKITQFCETNLSQPKSIKLFE